MLGTKTSTLFDKFIVACHLYSLKPVFNNLQLTVGKCYCSIIGPELVLVLL